VSDPSPLSTVETTVLSEGIKFLYSQAAELLRRWRERRDQPAVAGGADEPESTDTAAGEPGGPLELPAVFAPSPPRGSLDKQALAELAGELQALRRELQDYADGVMPVDPNDPTVLGLADALRRCLEVIWRRPLLFVGEQPDQDAQHAVVEGRVRVREVAGYAAAVRAAMLPGGTVRGHAHADRVWPGGQLLGVELGGTAPPESQPPPSQPPPDR